MRIVTEGLEAELAKATLEDSDARRMAEEALQRLRVLQVLRAIEEARSALRVDIFVSALTGDLLYPDDMTPEGVEFVDVTPRAASP